MCTQRGAAQLAAAGIDIAGHCGHTLPVPRRDLAAIVTAHFREFVATGNGLPEGAREALGIHRVVEESAVDVE